MDNVTLNITAMNEQLNNLAGNKMPCNGIPANKINVK